MRSAIFLDRDGTLIEEVHFLRRIDQVRLLPGVPEALRDLRDAGFALVVLTNQSGVARGLLTEETLAGLHAELSRLLTEQGVALDGIYYCPHHPDHGPEEYRQDCNCRKPAPGLFEEACRDLDLEPASSWAVGDRLRDLEGAARLGCRGILVRTGYGREEALRAGPGVEVAEDLAEAARRILARRGQGPGKSQDP